MIENERAAALTDEQTRERALFAFWWAPKKLAQEEQLEAPRWLEYQHNLAWEAWQARAALTPLAPPELHPLTADLVERFARALASKLAAAEKKYGYSDGWRADDWLDECRAKLLEHVAKGDPRDVAAYCAFLWHHGASTAPPEPPIQTQGSVDLAGLAPAPSGAELSKAADAAWRLLGALNLSAYPREDLDVTDVREVAEFVHALQNAAAQTAGSASPGAQDLRGTTSDAAAPERLNEHGKVEWWDVARALMPGITEEEFDEMWREFVALKVAHERSKGLQ